MNVLLEEHVWQEVGFGSGVGSHSFCSLSGCTRQMLCVVIIVACIHGGGYHGMFVCC